MVEYFGKNYYIDIDGITDKCRTIKTKQNNDDDTEGEFEDEGTIEINIFKYEIIKMCLERVLSEYEEDDNEMSILKGSDNSPISFKIAFNTLIKYEILIEDDE
jgi:hypothetical protein